jgi:hypothetical protein
VKKENKMEQILQLQDSEKKHKLVLKRDKHIIYIFNPKISDCILRYDLSRKSFEKLGKSKRWLQTSRQYAFFYNLSIKDIFCEEEHFKDLIQKASELNPRCSSLSTFISRLNESIIYENYIQEGIATECRGRGYGWDYKRVLTRPLEFYNKKVIAFFKKYKIQVTCRLEESFIKFPDFMNLIIEELSQDYLDNSDKIDLFRLFIESDYHIENVKFLMKNYNYDLTSLIKYLYHYLKPFENLNPSEAIDELKDFMEMASKIGRNVKKYPKYLRSMHDIITSNYNSFKRHYDEIAFQKLSIPELEFEGKDFCVIIPKNTKEIISEGISNNNCIGSYIDKIIKGETYLIFMRESNNKENSLMIQQPHHSGVDLCLHCMFFRLSTI